MRKIDLVKFICIFIGGIFIGGCILIGVLSLSQTTYAAVLALMAAMCSAMFFIMFACDHYMKDYIEEFHKKQERLDEMEEAGA